MHDIGQRVRITDDLGSAFDGKRGTIKKVLKDSVNVQLDGSPLDLNFAKDEVRPAEAFGFVTIYTNKDTSEAGPTVDEESATIEVEQVVEGTLIHAATDGPSGLWTVSIVLTPAMAASLKGML